MLSYGSVAHVKWLHSPLLKGVLPFLGHSWLIDPKNEKPPAESSSMHPLKAR